MKEIAYVFFVCIWIAGIVIAKGFWCTLFAIVMPPYSWYLFVELLMIKSGLI